MKILKLVATLLLLGILTVAMAETSVDEQISAIQNATPQERVKLVNAFKGTLSNLSKEQKTEAINQYKSSMRAGTANTQEIKTQTKTQTKQRNSVNQMQENQSMQRTQNMNQSQTKTQLMKQGGMGTGSGTTNGNKDNFQGKR